MTASFPATIASFPTRLDGQVIDNTHMNSVQEEIVAVQSLLGTSLLNKATGAYDAVVSSYGNLSSRIANIERGVASTDTAIHPQFLPKSGGTVQPSAGDVVSLVVRQSPNATTDVFQVKNAAGTSEYFSVHTDGSTNAYGRVIVGNGIDVTTNSDLGRNLRMTSGSTYSGPVIESVRGTTTTATLSATGNLSLAGNLVVSGSITAGSLANLVHTHENNAQGGRVIPAGAIMPWAGSSTAPDGWLLCEGQTVLRESYPDLFAAIGTAFGAGNGTTTFQLPNLRGRVPVGLDASQPEFSAIAQTGGSKGGVATHVHAMDHSHSGTTGNMSANADHAHAFHVVESKTGSGNAFGTLASGTTQNSLTASTEHVHAFTTSTTSGDTQSAGADNGNLQPFIVLRYLVKT